MLEIKNLKIASRKIEKLLLEAITKLKYMELYTMNGGFEVLAEELSEPRNEIGLVEIRLYINGLELADGRKKEIFTWINNMIKSGIYSIKL